MILSSDYQVQSASTTDIPALVRHHRQMFEEMGPPPNMQFNERKFKEMDQEYTKKLNEELDNGIFKA